MRYLDLTLRTAVSNLALDEALLLEADAGRGDELLRIWEWTAPAVVLGAAGLLADEVEQDACQRDDVPILRRSSGGGTVLLGRGCLLYTLLLRYRSHPALADIRSSYHFILSRICATLQHLAPGIGPAGTSDLAIAARKVGGSSQQRKRDFLLHHGTLLYNFEVASIGRYLKEPQRQPEYRLHRRHADFVSNIGTTGSALRDALREAWNAGEVATEWPEAWVQELLNSKYATESWVRRR